MARGLHLEVLRLVAQRDEVRKHLGVVLKGVMLLLQGYVWVVHRHLRLEAHNEGRLVVVVVELLDDVGRGD